MCTEVIMGNVTGDWYTVSSLELEGSHFYFVVSDHKSIFEGPFLTQSLAVQVLAERLLLDEKGSFEWIVIPLSLNQIDKDVFGEEVCKASVFTREQLESRKRARDEEREQQISEEIEFETVIYGSEFSERLRRIGYPIVNMLYLENRQEDEDIEEERVGKTTEFLDGGVK